MKRSVRSRRTLVGALAAAAVTAMVAFGQTPAPPSTPDSTKPGNTAFTPSPKTPPTPAIFAGADLRLGEQLLTEHRCAACHASKFGGDGSAVYRPGERITTPGLLRGMVEQCNTELNLGMFPEEVTAVAAVLQRDHYGFR